MIVLVVAQVGQGLFQDKLSARDTFSGVSRGWLSLHMVYLFSYFMFRRGDECVV
jgi:hypothetical protein